jgi:hypothetical protein
MISHVAFTPGRSRGRTVTRVNCRDIFRANRAHVGAIGALRYALRIGIFFGNSRQFHPNLATSFEAHIVHPGAPMPHAASNSESFGLQASRQDMTVAAILTALGLAAVFLAKGGIESMIAGSVGAVGAGCVAVALTFLDRRMNYKQRVQACLPIVFMLAAAGVAAKSNALALAGYPLLLLGVVGLLPGMIRSLLRERTAASVPNETRPVSSSPALSTTRVAA